MLKRILPRLNFLTQVKPVTVFTTRKHTRKYSNEEEEEDKYLRLFPIPLRNQVGRWVGQYTKSRLHKEHAAVTYVLAKGGELFVRGDGNFPLDLSSRNMNFMDRVFNAVYPLGSISCLLTGELYAELLRQKKFSPNSTLRSLMEWPPIDYPRGFLNITLNELATHTSGGGETVRKKKKKFERVL